MVAAAAGGAKRNPWNARGDGGAKKAGGLLRDRACRRHYRCPFGRTETSARSAYGSSRHKLHQSLCLQKRDWKAVRVRRPIQDRRTSPKPFDTRIWLNRAILDKGPPQLLALLRHPRSAKERPLSHSKPMSANSLVMSPTCHMRTYVS